MRVLVCGVVAAAASAAVWLGLEYFLLMEIGWLAIAVGLVTGWSVRKSAGTATGGGYARGGLAALLALAAIAGGQQIKAKVMEALNDSATPIAVVSMTEDQADDDSADAATSAAADSEVELEQPPIERIGIGAPGRHKMSRFSEMGMVWMCAAGLVAYIIGKGRDPIPASAEKTAEKTAEQPQDDSGQ